MDASRKFLEELLVDSGDTLELLRKAIRQIAYYRRLLKAEARDALTGLYGQNRYLAFLDDVESIAETAGVIFFDVNGLKECNDTKGHNAGDLLIQRAAESISALTDMPDVNAFRSGSDEFAIIITNCDRARLDAVCVAWRKKLAELNVEDDEAKVSIAAGAAFGAMGYRISDLLQLADERMYEEKCRMKSSIGCFCPHARSPMP